MVDLNIGRLDYDNDDINVLALVKGNERYVFLYDDKSIVETLRGLGRFASNPELSFTWYDAAVLSQKIRQEYEETEKRDWDGLILEQSYEGLDGLLARLFSEGLRN